MKIKKFLFYLLAGVLAGCIPVMSLHPLYTEEDVVFEEKLVGLWVNDSNSTLEFKSVEKPENTYELFFSDNEGEKGSFVAHLVKLENRLFLDVLPNKFPCKEQDEEEMEWPYNTYFIVPIHTFIRIDSVEPQLSMWLTDDVDFEKLLKEDHNTIEYESADGKIILTASTEELQGFVLKYADDNRVFSKEIVLSHKKTKEFSEPNDIDPNALDPNQTKLSGIEPNMG